MSQVSEQLQNRVRVSDKVVASARTHGPKVAAILAEQAIVVEGPATLATAAVFKTVIDVLANGLEHSTKTMRLAEQTVNAEKADDAPIRAKREEVTGEVAGILMRLRSTVETHLGADGLKTYGLMGDTARVPRKVVEQARNVAQLLEKKPTKISSPFGGSFDSTVAAATLQGKAGELEGVIGDDDREGRELEDALALRDRAVSAWSDAYQGTATALEGLYRKAGWKELAEKVRPTIRQVRGEDAGLDDDATNSGSGPDAPAAP